MSADRRKLGHGFNVIFRMVYLGQWVRRSNVLTGAEWMRTRFGKGRGAELAYLQLHPHAADSHDLRKKSPSGIFHATRAA